VNWVFIAILGGNLVTSMHANEEACRGRKAMWDKDHWQTPPNSQCVDMYPATKPVTLFYNNGARLGELSGTQSTVESWSR